MEADCIPKTIAPASQQMQTGLITSKTLVKHYLEGIREKLVILCSYQALIFSLALPKQVLKFLLSLCVLSVSVVKKSFI
ncbi:MAG: hypothetical protein V7K38_20300 [Nostoc sp.]|uniref:hypothetical protein n=1 Tax=Nostoc sp. TaxID=1180 RepID=UPI002FF5644D